jgi:hypothetical protein
VVRTIVVIVGLVVFVVGVILMLIAGENSGPESLLFTGFGLMGVGVVVMLVGAPTSRQRSGNQSDGDVDWRTRRALLTWSGIGGIVAGVVVAAIHGEQVLTSGHSESWTVFGFAALVVLAGIISVVFGRRMRGH